MLKHKYKFLEYLTVSLLLIESAFAYEDRVSCPSLTSPRETLNCALKNHPKIVRSRQSMSQSQEKAAIAGQWINPELETKAVTGDSLGDRIIEAEVSLAQTIELGGKRGARQEQAQAEIESSQHSLSQAQEEVAEEVISNLIRLRQIEDELAIVNEALHTFGTIGAQFRSRPRLTPEQQVSFGIFALAKGDYELKKASLLTEKDAKTRQIRIALGQSAPLPSSAFPTSKNPWPDWSKMTDSLPEEGPKDAHSRLALSNLKLSQSEYDLAKGESWPDLKLGPVVQYKSEGGIDYQTYGVSLSLPLPIFSFNGGGRAFALKGVDSAETNVALLKEEKKNEYQNLLTSYRYSTEALKGAPSVSEIEKKHKNIEALFAKGLIGGPSVIETHRQILDFTRGKNEHELSATQALLKLFILQGKHPGEAL